MKRKTPYNNKHSQQSNIKIDKRCPREYFLGWISPSSLLPLLQIHVWFCFLVWNLNIYSSFTIFKAVVVVIWKWIMIRYLFLLVSVKYCYKRLSFMQLIKSFVIFFFMYMHITVSWQLYNFTFPVFPNPPYSVEKWYFSYLHPWNDVIFLRIYPKFAQIAVIWFFFKKKWILLIMKYVNVFNIHLEIQQLTRFFIFFLIIEF